MIVAQAVDVMFQGVDASGGQVAALPHGAAKEVFESPGALDEFPAAGQHGADTAAQAFTQVDPDGIKRVDEFLGGDSARDRRVEQPRPVHVRFHPAIVSELTDGAKLLEWPDRAVAVVVRLLNAKHARDGAVSAESVQRV